MLFEEEGAFATVLYPSSAYDSGKGCGCAKSRQSVHGRLWLAWRPQPINYPVFIFPILRAHVMSMEEVSIRHNHAVHRAQMIAA